MVKLPIREIINSEFIVNIDRDYMIKNNYLIKQTDSLLFNQIERLRGYFSDYISEMILIEAKKNPKTKSDLEYIIRNGFILNGKRYLRFGKSASQAKDGITAFVCEEFFDELYRITQLNIKIDECVISKYESQRCLPFSSCTLIKDYNPNIVIIGEFEKVIKNQLIKYVVEKEKPFIDKTTGESKTYKSREIEEGFRDVTISPFDGCGCHEKEFSEKITKSLGLDYLAVGAQIRKPLIKGYSVYVPFREILSDMGVNTITDIYGKIHTVSEIDCIWNISMFKGHKLFKNKYGNEAWDKYCETVDKYKFPLGISKYSHHVKNINLMARMNFQYLQCLDLKNQRYVDWFNDKSYPKYDILDDKNKGKIITVAKYTTDLFEKIIKGDKFYTYKFMGITCTDNYEAESNYIKAALTNDIMLKDIAVKQFIHRKLKKAIQEAKIGKIYTGGFYHTVVGDMLGYLEYAAGKDVIGCLGAKEFYCETLPKGKVLSFRSPLVCPSEVNAVTLVSCDATKKYLSHFKDQDIVMLNMYDLSLPQQGGIKWRLSSL